MPGVDRHRPRLLRHARDARHNLLRDRLEPLTGLGKRDWMRAPVKEAGSKPFSSAWIRLLKCGLRHMTHFSRSREILVGCQGKEVVEPRQIHY
jgi:hypothetical protein